MNFFQNCTKMFAVVTALFMINQALAGGPPKDVPLDSSLNERIVMIEDTDFFKTKIQTTIFSPPGNGPFPLVIFNHGHSPGSMQFGYWQERERAILFTREMLKRGYVVALPMRKGYAGSGGGKPRDFTQQYEDVIAVANYMNKEPYVDKSRIVLAGHSVGGYVSMAMANKFELIQNLKGIINFAGGLPTTANNKFEHELKKISNAANPPALWIYGDNDYLTSPEELKLSEEAYRKNNPQLQVIRTGEFKASDAHYIMYNQAGLTLWVKPVEHFFQELGLPYKEVYSYEFRATDRKDIEILNNDAAQKALEMLHMLNHNQWQGYQKYLNVNLQPKAFAISTVNDRWGYSAGGDLSAENAVKNCEVNGVRCKVFSINNSIIGDLKEK